MCDTIIGNTSPVMEVTLWTIKVLFASFLHISKQYWTSRRNLFKLGYPAKQPTKDIFIK